MQEQIILREASKLDWSGNEVEVKGEASGEMDDKERS